MTFERPSENGHIDIVDSQTQETIARKYRFAAKKACSLCGERFAEGDLIEVLFPSSLSMDEGKEEGGPWGDGYTSKWLRANALDIMEVKGGITIHRAPYTKRFLGRANRSARYHALKSILRHFMGRPY
jgi:hypothetical protein